MKATFIPLTPDATGSYRMLFPARQLVERGGYQAHLPFEEEVRDDGKIIWKMDIDKAMARQSDLWVVQLRWERHWAERIMHDLRSRGIATVIECDDNYLETPPWNPAFLGTHPYRDGNRIVPRAERRKRYPKYAKVTNSFNVQNGFEMMRLADGIITSTPYLAEIYSKFNENVQVVRNYLDWDIWEDVTPVYKRSEWPRLRIGYLGVFNYRRGDLEVIRNVISKVMARHPEVDFVANTEATHDFLGVPHDQRITVGEYSFYEGRGGSFPVGQQTACLDLGLVPLTPGGMAEGKSHLKGMEYNAAGAPFICSNTESYRYWCDGFNGVTCHTEKEWEECLEDLIANPSKIKQMGSSGRKKAKQHSIQRNWERWDIAFRNVIGPPTKQIARASIKAGAVQKVSELTALLDEAAARCPKIVVEVGSARGGTFWGLAQVSSPDALLVSIDMPGGSPIDVREGKDVYGGRDRERMRTYIREGQRCVLIDGDSQSQETLERLLDTIGSAKIDVLFIDADHRYEGVKRDYELYSPLVRKGGLIAFHDVIPQNDRRSGVHILWNEIRKANPDSTRTINGKDNWNLGNWGAVGVLTA